MRILILSTSDIMGGAAIAAYRLMHALNKCGHEARMLVRDKTTDDPMVTAIKGGQYSKAIDRARIWMANGFTNNKLWLTDAGFWGCKVAGHPLLQWAEIIHLHWINQGFLSLDEIGKILHLGKKIVWTLHDMWPITGICHHAEDCTKFHTAPNRYGGGCSHCYQLCRPSAHDLATQVFNHKAHLYAGANITFVTCSRWLAERAQHSALTQGSKVINIPNCIDTETFRQMPRLASLSPDKSLILFSSVNVQDERKGVQYLAEACSLLDNLRDRVQIMVLGQHSKTTERLFPFDIISINYQSDPHVIAAINASADLFVTPSLQENLPNTIMEAMACGTPCVGFNVGGIPEMIDHMNNGYVARLRDTHDLAHGIRTTLEHHDEWGKAAREKVLSTYSAGTVVRQYISVYEG